MWESALKPIFGHVSLSRPASTLQSCHSSIPLKTILKSMTTWSLWWWRLFNSHRKLSSNLHRKSSREQAYCKSSSKSSSTSSESNPIVPGMKTKSLRREPTSSTMAPPHDRWSLKRGWKIFKFWHAPDYVGSVAIPVAELYTDYGVSSPMSIQSWSQIDRLWT